MKAKFSIIKDSLFFKSLKLARANPSKIGLMALFDFLFLVSAFMLYRLTGFFAPNIPIPKALSPIFVFLALSLIYYLVVLFAYSFFKYCLLDCVKSLFGNTEFSFRRLGQFYSLNIVIAGIFFAVMMLLSLFLSSINQEYAPFVFIVLAVPYLLFLYAVINA